MHLLYIYNTFIGREPGPDPQFVGGITYPIGVGFISNLSQYPNPLPDGMEPVAYSGWAISAGVDGPRDTMLTATIRDANGAIVDQMEFGGTFGKILKGTAVGGATWGGYNGQIYNGVPLPLRWPGPFDYYNGGPTPPVGTVGPNGQTSPVSRVKIPYNSTITVTCPGALSIGYYLHLATNNFPKIFADFTWPSTVHLMGKAGISTDDYPLGDYRRDYNYYPPLAQFEWWWVDEDTGQWRRVNLFQMTEEFYKPTTIYAIGKDVDGGQSINSFTVRYPERVPSVSRTRLQNGRVFQAAVAGTKTTLSTDTAVLNGQSGDGYAATTAPTTVVVEELTNEGFKPILSFAQTRQDGAPKVKRRANDELLFAYNQGNGFLLSGSTDNGKKWGTSSYMWTQYQIRSSDFIEHTDTSILTVGVYSDMWSNDGNTGLRQNTSPTIVRKLLFKRSIGFDSSKNIIWPSDGDAIHITDIDVVEAWSIIEERDGSLTVFNGSGRRFTSTSSQGLDWVEGEDVIAP